MERERIKNEEPITLRERVEKEIRAPDETFKPNPVHLTIMKEAKKYDGIYDRRRVIQKIKDSSNDEKLKKQMIIWNEVNLNTLVNSGYMVKRDDNIYIANPLAYDIQKSGFEPGKNHAKLLLKNKDGIIKTMDLKQKLKDKKPAEQKRQKTMIDGMVKKLHENGYVRRIGKGEYEITQKGREFIDEIKLITPSKRDSKVTINRKEFAVTGFDRCLNEVIKDGKIDEDLLISHSKSSMIRKRIDTFKRQGLINIDGSLTKECLVLLGNVMDGRKNHILSIDKLSSKQLQLVKDMRIFMNLSKQQIVEHIYDNNLILANMDLQFLVQKKVIKKDDYFGIYVMDKLGIELSNELYPDAVKYQTKLYGRKEELEHDMLVYTAYQNWLKPIIAKGGEIVDIKNDRQLRRDDAKKYGRMVGAYPDLRVQYKMPEIENTLIYDIEVDCGYDAKTIKSKINGLLSNSSNSGYRNNNTITSSVNTSSLNASKSSNDNLGWYCKTLYQAVKVANILTKDTTRASRMNVARKMTVYYMDKDGNLQTVRHKHWDK